MNENNVATNQAERNKKGQFVKGNIPKTSFRDRPQDRSNGRWDARMSFSYQYKKFLSMTVAEFNLWDEETSSERRSVIEDLAYRRIREAETSLRSTREITDRVDGRPVQAIISSGNIKNENEIKRIKGFVLPKFEE